MMKRPVDIFEFAALNTLRKVRNVTNAGNDVTIHPRESSNDDVPHNEFANSSDIAETTSNIQTGDGPSNDSALDDEDINWSSDAAKALIQLEYLRKIDMNVSILRFFDYYDALKMYPPISSCNLCIV